MVFEVVVVVAEPLVCSDSVVDFDAHAIVEVIVIVVVVVDVVLLCPLLPYEAVMELLYQDDDVDFYLAVDDVVYACSDVDVLLDMCSDVVVRDDQLDVRGMLMLTLDALLISDVVVVTLVLYNVVVDNDALCISLLDGLLSLYVCIYVADVVVTAVSRSADADVEAAFVNSWPCSGCILLRIPPLKVYSLCQMLISLFCMLILCCLYLMLL